jgi:STE24 endopeptidase
MRNETRAARYHRGRLQAGAAGVVAAGVVLLAFGPWALGPAAAAAVAAVIGSGPAAEWAATALFAATVLAAAHAARYPFDRHRDWTLEGRYGLARVPAARWTRGHLRGAFAAVVLGSAAALVIRAAWLLAGGAWWLAAAAVFFAAHIAWTLAAPLLLVVFGGLRPVRRGPLAARLEALVRRSGARVSVREWRGADDTTHAHAALAGLGRTRQIILSDTLVDTLRDEEVEVVVAHEIGHHVHGDVWRAAAWQLCLLPGTFAAAAVATARAGGPLGAWPLAGAAPVAGIEALPWLAVVAAAALVAHHVLAPIGLALSRRRELRADAYAIRLTGGADAFVSSMRRLSQTNLVDDEPPRLARLLSSHPPVRQRVLAALRHADAGSR